MPTRLPLSRIHTGRYEGSDDGDAPPPTPPPKDPHYTPNARGALRVAITQLPSASTLSCTSAQRSVSATRPPLSRFSSQQESDSDISPSSKAHDRSQHTAPQRTPGSAPTPFIRAALEPGTPADVPSTFSSPRAATRQHASDDQLSQPAREHRSFTTRRSKRRASPPTRLYSPVQAEPSASVEALFSAAIAAANHIHDLTSVPASPWVDSPTTLDMRRGRSQDGRPPTRERAEMAVESIRRSNSASPRSAHPIETEAALMSAKSLPTQMVASANDKPADQTPTTNPHPAVEIVVDAPAPTDMTVAATLDTPFESPAGWLMLDEDADEAANTNVFDAAVANVTDAPQADEPAISTIPPSSLMAASTVHGADTTPALQVAKAIAAKSVEAETNEADTESSQIYESDDSSSRSSLRSSLFLCLEGGKSTRSSSLTVGDDVKEPSIEPAECMHEDDSSGEDSASATANDSSSETANNMSYEDLTALPNVLKPQTSYESMNGKPRHGWSVPAAVPILPATAAMHRTADNSPGRSRDASFDSNVAPWCAKHETGYTSTTVTAGNPTPKSRLGNFFRKSSKSVSSATSPPPVPIRQITVQQNAHPFATRTQAAPFEQMESSYMVNITADGPPKSARKMNRLRAPFGSDLKAWDEDAFRRWNDDDAESPRGWRQARNNSVSSPATRKLSIGAAPHLTNGPPPAPSALANLNQGAAIGQGSEVASPKHAPLTPMSPAPSALSNHTTTSTSSGGGLSGFLRRKGSMVDKRPVLNTPPPHGRSMSVSSASTTKTATATPAAAAPRNTRTPSRLATSGNSVGRMAGIGESRYGRRGGTAEFAMAAAMIR